MYVCLHGKGTIFMGTDLKKKKKPNTCLLLEAANYNIKILARTLHYTRILFYIAVYVTIIAASSFVGSRWKK